MRGFAFIDVQSGETGPLNFIEGGKGLKIKSLKIRPIVSIVLLIMVAFFCQIGPAGGAPIVSTDKDVYHYGEKIKVKFFNSPGSDGDWICIVPFGSPVTEPGDYQYLPKGVNQGFLTFNSPTPGKYEVRAYYDYGRRGYVVTGRYPFSVSGVPDSAIGAAATPPIAHTGETTAAASAGGTDAVTSGTSVVSGGIVSEDAAAATTTASPAPTSGLSTGATIGIVAGAVALAGVTAAAIASGARSVANSCIGSDTADIKFRNNTGLTLEAFLDGTRVATLAPGETSQSWTVKAGVHTYGFRNAATYRYACGPSSVNFETCKEYTYSCSY
jgi:hypothetical protein